VKAGPGRKMLENTLKEAPGKTGGAYVHISV
jgi:hypothetical protein